MPTVGAVPDIGGQLMELQQIRYFLALAEELNFTRAAEKCGVSQPSLTRAIRSLEGELGAQLVRRERGRTHLTELGRMIKPRLEQALSLTELARSEAIDFSQMSTASLTLGVMCTIGPSRLISLIDHLATRVPQLELTLRAASGRQILELLLGGDIDVALVGMPAYPDGIAVHELYEEPYMIAFPPKHRFARMDEVSLRDLDGERYLERLNCEYLDFFNEAFGEFECELDVRYESEHEDWIQAMIIAGMGCAVIPGYMSLYPELQRRPLVDPEISRTIGVATVRGRPNMPIVGLFTRLCREMNWGTEAGGSAASATDARPAS